MDGLNEVKLIGNVGKDVDFRSVGNDRKVATIVLATNKTYKKQNGEKETKTEWHNVEFWGPTAQYCENYIKKGMTLYVNGELRTDIYEKEGVKQYRCKIVGSDLLILKGNNNNGTSNGQQTNTSQATTSQDARQQTQQYVAEPATATATSDTFVASSVDEDLPF